MNAFGDRVCGGWRERMVEGCLLYFGDQAIGNIESLYVEALCVCPAWFIMLMFPAPAA